MDGDLVFILEVQVGGVQNALPAPHVPTAAMGDDGPQSVVFRNRLDSHTAFIAGKVAAAIVNANRSRFKEQAPGPRRRSLPG
jgi:hypothetical protein